MAMNQQFWLEFISQSTFNLFFNFQLSNTAIKEYNRGRMYLRDLAVRQGVDLLDSVSAAVEVAARKCKTRAAR